MGFDVDRKWAKPAQVDLHTHACIGHFHQNKMSFSSTQFGKQIDNSGSFDFYFSHG
jgi:imidazolonepropionase-like amidohydrolase